MYERIGAINVERGRWPAGDAGTTRTLARMRQLAEAGARDLGVREAAITAVRGEFTRPHDRLAQLGALFRFVRDRITFLGDILGVETLQSPRYTLQVGAGDCDDRATLLVALARSIGIPARFQFKVVAANPARRSFSHVYVVADVGGRAIALDPTYPDNPPGWELPGRLRRGVSPA